MSDRISNRQLSLWEKFEDKEYRDGFVASHLANNISAQIFSTRELRGWTQRELAEKADMAQERISVMENSSYDKFSLTTLKRLASALDVALVVRLVPFSELANYATLMGPDKMAVRDFKNDFLTKAAAASTPRATQEDLTYINLIDLPAGQVVVLPVSGPLLKATPRAGRQNSWALNCLWDCDLIFNAESTLSGYISENVEAEVNYQNYQFSWDECITSQLPRVTSRPQSIYAE